MQEVVIQARANHELESSARKTEKEAGNIVNVISAATIAQSTDRTVADALQRVSGMSLVRNNEGEGRYVLMDIFQDRTYLLNYFLNLKFTFHYRRLLFPQILFRHLSF